jgi:hypothetical protein
MVVTSVRGLAIVLLTIGWCSYGVYAASLRTPKVEKILSMNQLSEGSSGESGESSATLNFDTGTTVIIYAPKYVDQGYFETLTGVSTYLSLSLYQDNWKGQLSV